MHVYYVYLSLTFSPSKKQPNSLLQCSYAATSVTFDSEKRLKGKKTARFVGSNEILEWYFTAKWNLGIDKTCIHLHQFSSSSKKEIRWILEIHDAAVKDVLHAVGYFKLHYVTLISVLKMSKCKVKRRFFLKKIVCYVSQIQSICHAS